MKKTFYVTATHRGVQYTMYVTADSLAEAAKLFKCSKYHLKQYGGETGNDNQIRICNEREGIVQAEVSGGEMIIAYNDLQFAIIPLEDLHKRIDDHRTICPTYKATLEWVDKGRPNL
jgi:hypothetical protein